MWITEIPAKRRPNELFSKYSETGKRSRRHHQKSKNGCSYCRRRRIKCDEGKPSCGICERKQQSCHYSTSGTLIIPEDVTVAANDSLLQPGFGLACLEQALAAPDGADHDLDDFLPLARLHARESLAHFTQCDQSWLKSSKVQRVLQQDAIRMVLDRPYVLHSVLALSAAHLAYLKPEKRSYRLASMVHWQHSLRSYSHHFPADIKSENASAIYFANMIQAMLAFVHAPLPLPGEGATRPSWVISMQGKKILLDMPHVVKRLSQTVWEPLVQAHDRWQERSGTMLVMVRDKVPSPPIQALLEHCKTLSPQQAIDYEERIRFLAMLEHVPPVVEAIGAFASFVAEAPANFVAKARAGESFALLLLFHWSGMFARLDQWWIAGPAIVERKRLYAHLSQHPESDLRNLLEILAQAGFSSSTPKKKCNSLKQNE